MNTKIYVYMKKGEDINTINAVLEQASQKRNDCYDLYTDSNRDYIAFKQLKRDIEKEKGLVIISSINNIGTTKSDVHKELTWLKENQIETVFIDYKATYIFDNPQANQLALSVIIDVYKSLLGNNTFDIRSEVTPATGRKKITFPDNWEELYKAWDNNEITAKEFIEKSGLKKGTFYHLVTEYKELLEINKFTMNVG